MISFEYTLTDPLGLHARPAGQLVKEAKKYKSVITLRFGSGSAEAVRMMSVMRLGTKAGDTLSVTVEGEDEEAAAAAIQAFFRQTV